MLTTLYAIGGGVVALGAWLISVWSANAHPVGGSTRALLAFAAGALWPVLLLGFAQFGITTLIARGSARLDPANAEELAR